MSEQTGFSIAADGRNRLAWRKVPGYSPTVVFLHGFRADKGGNKAQALAASCSGRGQSFLAFDLRGHGESQGVYSDFTVSDWLMDVQHMLHEHTIDPVILVGSSLGGWLMLRLAQLQPDRCAALIAVAPAPDFPTRLVLPAFEPLQRERYVRENVLIDPRVGFEEPTRFTRTLIEDSAQHNLLGIPLSYPGPVHFLQGTHDEAVPWQQTIDLAGQFTHTQARVTLISGGDHRLNDPAAIADLCAIVQRITTKISDDTT